MRRTGTRAPRLTQLSRPPMRRAASRSAYASTGRVRTSLPTRQEYLRRKDYKECYECIQGVHFQPRHRPPTHTACPYHSTTPADPNNLLNGVRPARYRRK